MFQHKIERAVFNEAGVVNSGCGLSLQDSGRNALRWDSRAEFIISERLKSGETRRGLFSGGGGGLVHSAESLSEVFPAECGGFIGEVNLSLELVKVAA